MWTSRFSVLVFVSACGGIVMGDQDGGTQQDAQSGACPSSPPMAGAACPTPSLLCEYGSNARWACDTVALCSSSGWQLSTPATDCPSPPCPADVQPGAACNGGGTCDNSTSTHTAFCSCVGGGPVHPDGGNPTSWICTAITQSCPAVRPRLGSACTQPNLDCDYSICAGPTGLDVICSGGTWIQGTHTEPCPL
jgi:hypothetical protein